MNQNKTMIIQNHSQRHFSLFNQPNKGSEKKENENYESNFDDLLKGGNVNEK